MVDRLAAANRRPRGRGWELCGEHADFIRSKLEDDVRLTKVRKLLQRQRQVRVSYMTLYRYAVEELGFGRRAATIPVADSGPGEEVPLDTGWVGWIYDLFGKRRRRFRAWTFTAVGSRHRFVYPVHQETTATAIEACGAAWGYFGGVFRAVMPDSTKAIVKEADPLDAKLVRGFLEYAAKVCFDRPLLNELSSLRFLESHHHVLIVGPVGVGKSFLAHALGHIACRPIWSRQR